MMQAPAVRVRSGNPDRFIHHHDSSSWALAQFCFLALLLVQFGLLISAAHSLSPTVDEPSHLAGGYTFLARRTLWTVPERGQPLLINVLEALPYTIAHPDVPLEDLPGWKTDYLAFVKSFVEYLGPDLEPAVMAARVPEMLLTVLLSAVVCRWARDLGGRFVGGIALLLAVFDPTLLAHGMLATNDVGVTMLGTAALYCLWRWTRAPGRRRAALTGGLLGLTMLAKGSGLLWVVCAVAVAIWHCRRIRKFIPGYRTMLALIALLPFAIVWAGHGFSVGRLPELPVPVFAPQYWTAVLFQAQHPDKAYAYALGRWRETGWLWYYPVAMVLKNPLPFLVLLPAGLVATLRRFRLRRRLALPLLFALGYTIAAGVVGPDIGYRHMLAIHPMGYLVDAIGVVSLWQVSKRVVVPLLRTALAALGLWYVAGTLSASPWYLSYFNEIVGDPAEGWRYLEASNTEWGQAWTALAAFETETGVLPDYSGWLGYSQAVPRELWAESLPATQGAPAVFAPNLYPAPGDYVLSATSLSGAQLGNRDNYSWFRYHEPDAVIADALVYYHVEATAGPRWLAQCSVPTEPLSVEAIEQGFGTGELRTLAFDCTQTWVYPAGGAENGDYALHADALQPASIRERLHLRGATPVDSFAASHLSGVAQTYRQWENQTSPAFALFAWSASTVLNVPTFTGGTAAAETPPSVVAITHAGDTVAAILLEESFAFLGHSAPCYVDGVLEIETWWEVLAESETRPISFMAHLITAEGTPLAVADGLGVSPLSLEQGDVVVQRHRFEIAETDDALWLRTGIYTLDTQTRLKVDGTDSADAIFVALPAAGASCD